MNTMWQKLRWKICTHLSYFITRFELYYWLKKVSKQGNSCLLYKWAWEQENYKRAYVYIYLKGHNPYHTRPCLSYIKGKILSIYICYLRKRRNSSYIIRRYYQNRHYNAYIIWWHFAQQIASLKSYIFLKFFKNSVFVSVSPSLSAHTT